MIDFLLPKFSVPFSLKVLLGSTLTEPDINPAFLNLVGELCMIESVS